MRLSEQEIAREIAYRITERLGILHDGNTPTEEQIQIANKEAEDWRTNYLKENP